MILRRYFLFLSLLIASQLLANQSEVIVFTAEDEKIDIGQDIFILTDPDGTVNIDEAIASEGFVRSEKEVPNLQVSNDQYWVKFSVKNESSSTTLYLEIETPTIDVVDFYFPTENGYELGASAGVTTPLSQRTFRHQNPVFALEIPQYGSRTYYLQVSSGKQLQLPIGISTPQKLYRDQTKRDLIFGLYAGIIIVMLLYNLFIFLSIRDKAYFIYVVYILIVGMTQADFQGYGFRYMWSESTWLASHITYILSSAVGIAAVLFMRVFINTKVYAPGWHRGLNIFMGIYGLCIVMGLVGFEQASYQLIQLNAMLTATAMIIAASRVAKKGYRPAYFFLLAWSIFLIGVMVFVLKDFGVLPYNWLTYYTMPFGSAVEVVLLSFGLADRINTLKKEKEASQAQALKVARENEKILQQQANILERKVKERTQELEASNEDLKRAQSQLVNAEKMASIGQLTAGIAHEINNPINFVSSNISPLKRNLQELISVFREYEGIDPSKDLKPQMEKIEMLKKELETDVVIEEIDEILESIGEGASRTAEIVRGLRNFSRLDEDALKSADINDGLRSTVALLNPKLRGSIEVNMELEALPKIDCYPGKLNQVFMNMISNAAQAIKAKNGSVDGRIDLSTSMLNEEIKIKIRDNGIGMNEETRNKLFDPFFTTKDVGEGTGLGMSISLGIIEDHNGTIEVDSKPGEGTEFTLTIPSKQE